MGATLGAHPSQLRGNSSEFSEFRPYRQGDDPRRVDWRLLARSDRAYVRLTTDRATFRTSMIVDASASMAFPELSLAKWRVARELAVGLASVAHGEADPVGLTIASPAPVVLAPRARRSVLLEMMKALDATTPSGSPSIAPFLTRARAARLVVITDLLGDFDEMLAAARLRVAARDEVVVVHVIAAEELDPPTDAMLAVDPEQPALRRTLDASARAGYREAFTQWSEAAAIALRAAGVRYIRAVTTEATAHLVRRVADDAAHRGPGG